MRQDGSIFFQYCALRPWFTAAGEPRGSCFQSHRFQPSHRSLARLDQITPRLSEFDLGLAQLSCRIESIQHALRVEGAAPLEPDRDLAPSFRLIVAFLLPNDEGGCFRSRSLGLPSMPGSAATAGRPRQPHTPNLKPSGINNGKKSPSYYQWH